MEGQPIPKVEKLCNLGKRGRKARVLPSVVVVGNCTSTCNKVLAAKSMFFSAGIHNHLSDIFSFSL